MYMFYVELSYVQFKLYLFTCYIDGICQKITIPFKDNKVLSYLNNSTVPLLLLLLFSWCFRSTETIRLIRDGRRWGKRKIIYLSLHCHHQNDSCIKVGSDESHFDVSLIVRDRITRQCPQITTFLKRKESRSRIEPKPFRLQSVLTPYARPIRLIIFQQ